MVVHLFLFFYKALDFLPINSIKNGGITDDRHGSSSTILISQLPTDQWYQSIGDNTLADAILDRLMHNAHRIKLKGESMRKTLTTVDAT